ncbi:L,D-transpeptidase family protein [Cohaesibacter celericrescens]|uniref:Transcriptional regulator n=1 Tax=Cohaesibacter celericrescens TaxID=2067669 RepID=A0A2N5XU98_9HYPH|nr:murein L,D-transpeptidase family protein [Cohaesibacter celericrescens]PLW78092.1 transcriptional regulator [Cohaesibacter celericrescens]
MSKADVSVRTGNIKQMNRLGPLLALTVASIALTACNPGMLEDGKHLQPIPAKIKDKIRKIGSTEKAPIYIRIFKEEAVLEAWKERKDGTYALLKTYPICAYSGEIGPKKREGDRQAPEGFYAITRGQMNPQSSYYLSFNLGYPNKFDRSYGRTGKHLMVHGSCSSRGCYAMEDAPIAEIYSLGREAFSGGQRSFKVHAFPFRMTPENMARNRNSEHFAFWQNLKNGYDHFQITHKPPKVEVCNRTYIFDPQGASHFDATGPCPDYTVEPSLLASLKTLRQKENIRFQQAALKLEQKVQEKEVETADAMVESQLELLERKQKISEGKNPDGFLAGLIKGNPAPTAASQAALPVSGIAAQSAPSASIALAEPETEAPSGGFFSKLTSAIPNPFGQKKQPIILPQTDVSETINTLPQPRQ